MDNPVLDLPELRIKPFEDIAILLDAIVAIRYIDKEGNERMTYGISDDTKSCAIVGLETTVYRRIMIEHADAGWIEGDD